MAYKQNPKLLDQLQHCEKHQIELCVITGNSELQNGLVKIRDVAMRQEVRAFDCFDHRTFAIFSLKFHETNSPINCVYVSIKFDNG